MENVESAAQLLFDAWRMRQRIADLPREWQPADIAGAYAIQDAVIRRVGPIGGWKVAPPKVPGDPRCSPIPAAKFFEAPAVLPLAEGDAPEIEVEIAVKLKQDLPPRAEPYGVDEVRAAIGSAHPALEVLLSRFSDRKAVSLLTSLADSQSNGAVILGPATAAWRDIEFGSTSIGLFYNGKEVGAAEGGPSSAMVLDALVWLANHAATRCGGLKAGQVVITGARVGPVPVGAATLVEADLLSLGQVSLSVSRVPVPA